MYNSGMEFVPAKSKLEAVARISNLTNSGPEFLGPGSKEHKRVFINLAMGLNLSVDVNEFTKQGLARYIVEHLGGSWSSTYESVGATITLDGLNKILELASHFFNSSTSISNFSSVNDEARIICDLITLKISNHWDGKNCVLEMKEGQSPHWRQTEWQGFYFEFKVKGELINTLGGGPIKVESTEFDYKLKTIWDLKVHSNHGQKGPNFPISNAPLNDIASMKSAVKNHGGLGLVILSGNPTYSTEFTVWHKAFRGKHGNPTRQLKEKFEPTSLDAFYIEDNSILEKVLEEKLFEVFKQGKQPGGQPRAPKYSINLEKARGSEIHIFNKLF